MALLFLIVVAAITIGSSVFLASHSGWLPALASVQGGFVDEQFTLNFIVIGSAFLITQSGLAWFVWRYRARPGGSASTSHGSNTVEVIWTLATFAIFVGLGFTGALAYSRVREYPSIEPSRVEVTAVQFAWYYRYPGADGKLGQTKAELIDAAEGNPLGLDATDSAAADDIVTSTLFLPLDHPAELTFRAQDVIHSFFVPEFRIKQDAVPGLRTSLLVTPTKTGAFDVACAELCGLGHARMGSRVEVLPRAEFDRWLARQGASQHGTQVGR